MHAAVCHTEQMYLSLNVCDVTYMHMCLTKWGGRAGDLDIVEVLGAADDVLPQVADSAGGGVRPPSKQPASMQPQVRAPDDGVLPVAPDDAVQPVAPDDGVQPLAPDDGVQPGAPDDGVQPVAVKAPAGQNTPPLPQLRVGDSEVATPSAQREDPALEAGSPPQGETLVEGGAHAVNQEGPSQQGSPAAPHDRPLTDDSGPRLEGEPVELVTRLRSEDRPDTDQSSLPLLAQSPLRNIGDPVFQGSQAKQAVSLLAQDPMAIGVPLPSVVGTGLPLQ
jgi:hypothetical protein